MNWGWGISIFIFLFIGFMVYMAVKTTTVRHELVTENYYQKELAHQDEIDKARNFKESNHSIKTTIKSGTLSIDFGGQHNFSNYTGKVYLYNPAAISGDDTLTISLDKEGTMIFPLRKEYSGRYLLSIDFSDSTKEYLYEEELYIP